VSSVGGLEAGRVFAFLGYKVDERGADRFEDRLTKAERRAQKPIDAKIGFDVNERGAARQKELLQQTSRETLKLRDSQLKLEGAQVKAAAAADKHGRESLAFRRALLDVDKATRAVTDSQDKLENKTREVSRSLTDFQREAAVAGDGAGEEMAVGFLDRLKGLKGGVLAAGAAIGVALTAGVNGALERESLTDALAAKLNLSGAEAERAGKVAGKLYADAYGDSLGEVNDAVRSAMQNLDIGPNDPALRRYSETLLSITKTFGAESDEITRSVSTLMRNGLAKNADQAFDIITAGFQSGADRGGEFLDTLNEYAAPLAALGYSMEDFVDVTEQGFDAGVYSVDKMGDALKEFSIRAIDGSDATALGFKQAGLNVDEYSKKIAAGGPTAKQATGEVIDALLGMDDKALQSQAGFALFGAMFEDIKAKGVGALKPVGSGIDDVDGRARKLNETLGSNNATEVTKFKRRMEGALTDVGAGAIRVAKTIRERIPAALDTVADSEAGRKVRRGFKLIGDTADDIGDRISRAFEGADDDLRPIGRAIAWVAEKVTDFYQAVAQRMIPGIVRAFEGLARSVRGVIRVIGGILSGDFGKAWQGVKDIFSGGISYIRGAIRAATAPLRTLVSGMASAVSGPLSGVWGGVRKAWSSGLDFVLGGVSTASGAIASLLDAAGKLPVVGGKFKGLADDVRAGQRAIDRYRESLRDTDRQHGKTGNIEKQRDAVNALRRRLSTLDKGTEDYRQTAEKLRSKERALAKATEDLEPAARKGQRGMRGLGSGAKNAASATLNAASNIIETVRGVAKGLGVKAPTFTVGKAAGSAAGSGTSAFTEEKAGGGWVGSRGQAGHDSVRRDLPAGSAVVNRHQAPILEAALATVLGRTLDDRLTFAHGGRVPVVVGNGERILDPQETGVADVAMRTAYGVGLGDLFAAVTRPHYLASGGGVHLDGAKPGLAPYARAASKFGLHVSSGKRGAGQRTASGGISQHGSGDAIDLVGPAPSMLSFARSFAAKYGPSVDQLIHTPLGFGWSRGRKVASFGAAVDRGHFDHVHIGDSTPGGAALGGGDGNVATPKIGGPAGGLRDLVKGAAKLMAGAANKWVGEQAPDIPAVPGGGGAAGTAQVRAWARQALSRPGSPFPPTSANIAALVSRIMQESGGDPNVQNNWDINAKNGDPSVGLAQTIGATFRAYRDPSLPNNPRHPIANLAAALNYMKSRYGRVVAANGQGYARGGIVEPALQALAGGGFVEAQAFAGGGKVKAKPKGLKDRLDNRYDTGASDLRSLSRPNTDRIAAYDSDLFAIDNLGKDYGLQERRNDMTEEVLIDEDTGAVNVRDVKRRAGELAKLWSIRLRVQQRLKVARATAARVVATYRTAIKRLKAARAAAQRSKSKKRKSAIASYTRSIGTYTENKTEWEGKLNDLKYDIKDANLDLESLANERVEVLGTTARPPEPTDSPDPPDPPDQPDGEGSMETPSEAAPASPADIAAAAMAQVSAFQSSRADLFGSFGANFRSAQQGSIPADVLGQAAGLKFYGGSASGSDGGVFAGGGGGRHTTIEAVNMTFAGPQPVDPHTATQALVYELGAL
jgi:hypothetical protein